MSVQENRNKWIEALRSGEYKQTKEVLYQEGYCCLGVLVKLYEDETGERFERDDYGRYEVNEDTLEELPQVMEWVGLQDSQGKFKHNDHTPSTLLTELNDTWNWNFNKIADLIESEPEGLFYN